MNEERTSLVRRKIAKTIAMSKEMLDSGDLEVMDDWMANQVRIGIHGFLWAEEVGQTRVEWPANAWEHLKKHLGLSYRKDSQLVAFFAYYPEFRPRQGLGPVSLRVESIWEPPDE